MGRSRRAKCSCPMCRPVDRAVVASLADLREWVSPREIHDWPEWPQDDPEWAPWVDTRSPVSRVTVTVRGPVKL